MHVRIVPVKTCVIFNPAARGEKARRFRKHLAEMAPHAALRPTDAPGAGRRLAAEAVREGFGTLVAAGGDGTVNEVLNGLADEPDGLARARLGVLPLGTVNVFAKELGMPIRWQDAWAIIEQGRETWIDLATADFLADGRPQRRAFVQMAGTGVDARAVELVNWKRKKRFGYMAYVLAGVQAMSEPKARITVTAGTQRLEGEQVLIGNGRYYGGRFRLFPDADLRDGLLEVTVLPRATWRQLIRGAWGLLLNRLYTTGGVRHLRAETLQLSSTGPVRFHLEGEDVGQLPVTMSVRKQVLRVLVPGG